MPIGPLKNLPIFRSSGSTQSGRAQSFSPTHLGKDSIKSAKTSMSRAMGSSAKISTSISHPGGRGQEATTSISRPAEVDESLSREGMSDQERDDRRYNYIRRMVMQKKKEEEMEELAEAATREMGDVHQKTVKKVGFIPGKLSRMSGVHGMKMKLRRAVIKNKSEYKNISAKDREYILDLVSSRAGKVGTGRGFGREVRKDMRRKVQRDWKKGVISRQDVDDIKKLIDNLPH